MHNEAAGDITCSNLMCRFCIKKSCVNINKSIFQYQGYHKICNINFCISYNLFMLL